ncbi:hypothetical protein H9L15_12025 [Sphingomonas daechungensis]|uniref:Uncharacterized protein n=1 Tax=Sphingomonas daechungensis TaxID=1176646 RepID=A0ABX6T247_9SPHN|nr:hypothetical protein [Sphingomonas daechungensis]QNP42803.1 hypothetical protein H9L15_12025 [Sphingomonas daechungensis]
MDHASRSRLPQGFNRLSISVADALLECSLQHPVWDQFRAVLKLRLLTRLKKIEGVGVLDRAEHGVLVTPDHRDHDVMLSEWAHNLDELFEAGIPLHLAVLDLRQAVGLERRRLPLPFALLDGALNGVAVAIAEQENSRLSQRRLRSTRFH